MRPESLLVIVRTTGKVGAASLVHVTWESAGPSHAVTVKIPQNRSTKPVDAKDKVEAAKWKLK